MTKFLKSAIRSFWIPLQIVIISTLIVLSVVSVSEIINIIPFEAVVSYADTLLSENYNLEIFEN